MVGAFPKGRAVSFHGGQLTMAREMMKSSLPERIDIVTLDSTQRAVPAPSLPIRMLHALWRLPRFLFLARKANIGGVVVVTADGPSLIEKTLMLGLARIMHKGTASWVVTDLRPRADASRLWLWWSRRLVIWSDVLICQGPSVGEVFQESFGASSTQCVVVPNFVDIDFWSSGSDDPRGSDAVFAGWISREKGVVELVRAVASSEQLKQHRFHLCGGGPLEDEVASLIETLSLQDSFVMNGWVAREELRDLLHQSAVFVLPSYIEGFPMSVIEAMAAGAAVVTTPVGAVPDYLIDGVNALFVTPRSEKELAHSLERVFGDEELRNNLQREGRKLAHGSFSIDQATAQLEAVFERILA
jgi:glycosyltransferase involved in cell wall biosynthesis